MHGRARINRSKEEELEHKLQEKREVERYKQVISSVLEHREKKSYTKEALQCTTTMLELNPEFHTVWNYRREILLALFDGIEQAEKQQFLDKDLEFINKAIRKNIKSYWMWNHRLWILENMPTPGWDKELGLVDMLFNIDATNFHGWDYRRMVVERLKALGESKKIITKEFNYTKSRIKDNFANHSAWHYRSKLLPQVMDGLDHGLKSKVLSNEVKMIKTAIYSDPDDQNAWLYYDWLIEFDSNKDKMIEGGIVMAKELLELEPNSKYALKVLVKYNTYHSQSFSIPSEKIKECLECLERLKRIDTLRLGQYQDMEKSITFLKANGI